MGIFINALNCIYYKQWQKLTFDIITGFFIFLGLIGYMIVLIYVKWWFPVHIYVKPATVIDPDVLTISTSPSIITLLIGDVMGLTGFASKNNPNLLWFPQQQDISNYLVYITFICLPIMLCAIPCIAICCGKKHSNDVPDEFAGVQAHNNDDEDRNLLGG